MADGEKPYRLYRGGRVRGGVPTLERPRRRRDGDGVAPGRVGPTKPKRRRIRLTRGRVFLSVVLLLILLLVVWAVASWLAFDRGVAEANQRLSPRARAALVPHEGLLMSRPTTTLLMGTDHADRADRADANRSDSIMLVRTDPEKHRITYLSVPRDLRVDIPGHGTGKINAAFALGGPALAMRTITAVTGVEINHVALVDFNSFRDLIDELGGVTVNVPAPIVSNRFDCPFPTNTQCQNWQGWRFAKGKQKLDGRRALIYSRIRENRLNPAENDLTRGERQQAVVQAIGDRLTSPSTLLKLPFVGDDLLKPLATDLTSGQFLQLAWMKVRSPEDRTLHCRLGGSASFVGGESFIIGTEENRNVIAMFLGRAAAQPPLPGSGPFGPGCVIGNRS
jgi:polyisoprenyl-teichoic acid--peptidoglycan teichoic acid transferase